MDKRVPITFYLALFAILCSGIVAKLLTADIEWRSDVAAAWVQAVGSIIAIFASTAVAIFAPLYLRDVEAKGAALHAFRNSVNAGAMVIGAWKALRMIYEQRKMNAGTSSTMGSQIAAFHTILAEIPRHLLGPDALLAIGLFESHAVTLTEAIPHMLASQDDPNSDALPFDELEAHLEERLIAFDGMGPVKIGGVWIVDYVDPERRRSAYAEQPDPDPAG